MKKIFAFMAVIIAILMLSSCINLTDLIGKVTGDIGESQVSSESSEQPSELTPQPNEDNSSSIPESSSAAGISSLSDEELDDIAEDIVIAWNEYCIRGVVCEREVINNYDFLLPYLDDYQQEVGGIEKCICCHTKEDAKEHLAKYFDLPSIAQDMPSCCIYFLENDIYYYIDNLLYEYEGNLYYHFEPGAPFAYDCNDMNIKRIDNNIFSATVDRYDSMGYDYTSEFLIKHNGDNYVAFKINEVSGPIFLSNVNENVVLPYDYYFYDESTYYVDADGGLNMRYGPGQNHEKIMLIPNGAEVICRGVDESCYWCFIEYDGQFGWVAKEFIKFRHD